MEKMENVEAPNSSPSMREVLERFFPELIVQDDVVDEKEEEEEEEELENTETQDSEERETDNGDEKDSPPLDSEEQQQKQEEEEEEEEEEEDTPTLHKNDEVERTLAWSISYQDRRFSSISNRTSVRKNLLERCREYMTSQRLNAKLADDASVQDLQNIGLDVFQGDIPIGRSRLNLSEISTTFSSIPLIQASTLMKRCLSRHERRVMSQSSSNDLFETMRQERERPSYLADTEVFKTRKSLQTLKFRSTSSLSSSSSETKTNNNNNNKKKKKKPLWMTTMPGEEKERNEHKAKLMKAKLNFLTNPRSRVSSSKSNFRAYPKIVTFDSYTQNEMKTLKLLLKNVSSSSRMLRVLPPSTTYFSIREVKLPTPQGIVAPGVDCEVTIDFLPDTRGEYRDEIRVVDDSSIDLIVPICAKRESSNLVSRGGGKNSLVKRSTTLNVGSTLRGEISTTEFRFRNKKGGPTTFAIVKTPPQTNRFLLHDYMEKYDEKKRITNGAFTAEPACFKVDRDENVSLKISFEPKALGQAKTLMYLIADNCTVRELNLEGFGCDVDIRVLDFDGVRYDDLLPRALFQGDCVLGDESVKILRVQNINPMPMSFRWDFSSSSSSSSSFQIEPREGHLKENETKRFEIRFCPGSSGICRTRAHLAMGGGSQDEMKENLIHVELIGTGVRPCLEVSPSIVRLTNAYVRRPFVRCVRITNPSPVPIEPSQAEILPNEYLDVMMTVTCLKSGEMRKIVSFGHNASLCLLVRTNDMATMEMSFTNLTPVKTRWCADMIDDFSTSDVILEPNEGIVDAHETVKLRVHVKSKSKEESFQSRLRIRLDDSSLDRYISLRASVRLPRCVVVNDPKDFALGTTFRGVETRRVCVLRNLSEVPAQFNFSQLQDDARTVVSFEPVQDTIMPGQEAKITVNFTSHREARVEALCVCDVEGLPDPIGLVLTSLVRGVIVSYTQAEQQHLEGEKKKTSSEDTPLPTLDFGQNVPLRKRRSLFLRIQNHSAIETSFRINSKKYPPAQGKTISPPSTNSSTSSYRSERGRAYEEEKLQLEFATKALRDGRGVTFVTSPSRGVLGPWSHTVIRVDCYSDIANRYRDELECQIESLPMTNIPIVAETVGTPLQIDRNLVGMRQDSLNWSAVPFKSGQYFRKLRVRNLSSVKMRLNWIVRPNPDEDEPLVDVELEHEDKKKWNVKMRDHVSPKLPFEIEPKSIDLTPHSVKTFDVRFQSDQVHDVGKTCAGLVAMLSTTTSTTTVKEEEEEDGVIGGKLWLRAETFAPRLTLDRERYEFETWITKDLSDKTREREIVLTNNTRAPLRFSLDLKQEDVFQIETCKVFAHGHSIIDKNMTTRAIHDRVMQSEFCGVDYEYIVPCTGHARVGLRFLKGDRVKDELVVRYANGEKQVVNLEGRTLVPRLLISRHEFEFGKVHLKRSRKLGLVLSNPTRADVVWNVVVVGRKDDDDDEQFRFSTINGVLTGPTVAGNSGLVKSYPAAGRSGFLKGGMPLEIYFEFDPRKVGQVEKIVRIHVKGGESVDIVLRGEGVLDENLL